MNIGVAIVTHNNEQDIAACIESVLSAGISDIAIVDSASNDGTVAEITRLGRACEDLRENLGFGYAANKAARLLNTEYVLFLNPDAKLIGGAIEYAAHTMQAIPRVGIVGMLLSDSYMVPEKNSYGEEPGIFNLLTRHAYRNVMPRMPVSVGWVSGGALLISREFFEKLGGFDEGFFLYWEDIDLCHRARAEGRVVMLDPRALVVHRRGGSKLNKKKKTLIYDDSADRYYKKHYPIYIWKLQRFLRSIYRLLRPRVS